MNYLDACYTIHTSYIIAHSDSIFCRTLLGYYAEGMHANFKKGLI